MWSKWDWIASSGKGAVAYSSQGAVHRDMGLWCHQLPNVNAGKIFCFWPHLWPRHYCGSAHTQHRHHSAYKLNKQDNIQPWCTPFLIWNQSVFPCPVLTVASWPSHRFLRRQITRSGIPSSWKNALQFVVIHTKSLV